MNKANILKLADYIESEESFNMKDHKRCFIGQASKCFGEDNIASALNLTTNQFVLLTTPEFPYADYYVKPTERGFISRHRAVRQLRRLAETGEVDWEPPDRTKRRQK